MSDERLASRDPEELRAYAAELLARVQRLSEIGIALSAERDLPTLLERILSESRRLTCADAGTIYLLREDGLLHFAVVHNEPLRLHFGGASGDPIPEYLAPFAPDLHHVSGCAALAGEIVNIPDVYEADGFDFSGTRAFDRQTGYRSRSVLVVPMRNHEETVVGVLQLFNAQSAEGRVVPFTPEIERFVESLASQAAVSLTNAQLILNLEGLFESLIQVMAKAVDEKDPTTAGHIARVTRLSLELAKSVSESEEAPYQERRFTSDEMNELRIAGWLHDIGKLTTPEWVINKGKKLEALFDRAELLRERFQTVRALRRIEGLRARAAAAGDGASIEAIDREAIDREAADADAALAADLEFLLACNEPDEFMEEDRLARLKGIASRVYRDMDGVERPLLTADEMENLSIRKGSITFKELQIMREHVSVTIRMLALVPFIKKLRNVPLYAGQHHEMLDGSGYPARLAADSLSLQSRILAVCDIFDALSAKDRPYKKAFSLEHSIAILRADAAKGKLDEALVELFVQDRVWERVADAPPVPVGPG